MIHNWFVFENVPKTSLPLNFVLFSSFFQEKNISKNLKKICIEKKKLPMDNSLDLNYMTLESEEEDEDYIPETSDEDEEDSEFDMETNASETDMLLVEAEMAERLRPIAIEKKKQSTRALKQRTKELEKLWGIGFDHLKNQAKKNNYTKAELYLQVDDCIDYFCGELKIFPSDDTIRGFVTKMFDFEQDQKDLFFKIAPKGNFESANWRMAEAFICNCSDC